MIDDAPLFTEQPTPPSTIQGGSVVYHEVLGDDGPIYGLLRLANQMQALVPATEHAPLKPIYASEYQTIRFGLVQSLKMAYDLKPLEEANHPFITHIYHLTQLLREGADLPELVDSLRTVTTLNVPLSFEEQNLLDQIAILESLWIKNGESKEQAQKLVAGELESLGLALLNREETIAAYIQQREQEHDLFGKVVHEFYPDPNVTSQQRGRTGR